MVLLALIAGAVYFDLREEALSILGLQNIVNNR